MPRLEELFGHCVQSNHPYGWHEDHVTEDLLRGLRERFQDITVTGFPDPLSVHWSAYKHRGAPEEPKYGDISVLVHTTARDGHSLTGVALLEAKKRKERSSKFDQIRIDQLKKIHGNAPHSMLLLYDYEKISSHPVDPPSPFEALYLEWSMTSPTPAPDHQRRPPPKSAPRAPPGP